MPTLARSFWGWGYSDKFPDDDARRALAEQVGSILGAPLSLSTPPKLSGITLAPPRFTPPPALAALGSCADADRVTHTYGRSYRDPVRGVLLDP